MTRRRLFLLAALVLAFILTGDAGARRKIVVGFAQVGAESAWRTANTESIISEAKKRGIELKYVDGQQQQENQIKAIRSFIAQKVDVIGFSPVVTSGWEQVLREAKRAGIPVILTDRAVDCADDSLWVTFIGSDFVEEGRQAARWLVKKMNGQSRIFEMQGTIDSAPAIDRKKGFEEVIIDYPGMKIIRSQTGDFSRSKGKDQWRPSSKRKESVLTPYLPIMTIWRSALFKQSKNMVFGRGQTLLLSPLMRSERPLRQ